MIKFNKPIKEIYLNSFDVGMVNDYYKYSVKPEYEYKINEPKIIEIKKEDKKVKTQKRDILYLHWGDRLEVLIMWAVELLRGNPTPLTDREDGYLSSEKDGEYIRRLCKINTNSFSEFTKLMNENEKILFYTKNGMEVPFPVYENVYDSLKLKQHKYKVNKDRGDWDTGFDENFREVIKNALSLLKLEGIDSFVSMIYNYFWKLGEDTIEYNEYLLPHLFFNNGGWEIVNAINLINEHLKKILNVTFI